MLESVFSFRRLSRLVRIGDSRRFALELEKDGDNIIAQIAADATAKLVLLSAFAVTKVKRKDCVAYPQYPENIVLRAVANYVARRFRVAASNRDRTVRGVIEALYDQTPFYVIRRDLSSFYETIPLEPVRSRLVYDTAIPRAVRHYLKEFFDHHCGPLACGLPRGVGLTTVLVELAMEPFDNAVKSIPGVYRYFRYSDDILVFTYKDPESVQQAINSALKKLPGMKFNLKKSDVKDFAGDKNPKGTPKGPGFSYTTAKFDYLGYRFEAEQRINDNGHRKITVSIADKKITLLKTRVFLSLKSFERNNNGGMLVDRMRILTGNYRINRRGISVISGSRYIYAGIYFNYWRCGTYASGLHTPCLPEVLRQVDKFYHSHLKSAASPFRAALDAGLTLPQLEALKRMSFERGYLGKRMVHMPFQRFAKVKAVWRNA